MSNLSTGLSGLVVTCDRLEQRDRVELDLDMVVESWEVDTVLFLSSSGVEPGVVRSGRGRIARRLIPRKQ